MSDSAALIPAQGSDYRAALSAPSLGNLRRIVLREGELWSDPLVGGARVKGALGQVGDLSLDGVADVVELGVGAAGRFDGRFRRDPRRKSRANR